MFRKIIIVMPTLAAFTGKICELSKRRHIRVGLVVGCLTGLAFEAAVPEVYSERLVNKGLAIRRLRRRGYRLQVLVVPEDGILMETGVASGKLEGIGRPGKVVARPRAKTYPPRTVQGHVRQNGSAGSRHFGPSPVDPRVVRSACSGRTPGYRMFPETLASAAMSADSPVGTSVSIRLTSSGTTASLQSIFVSVLDTKVAYEYTG